MKVEENYVDHLERCLLVEQAREEWDACPEWWVALQSAGLQVHEKCGGRKPSLRFLNTSDGKVQYLLWYLKKRGQLHLVPANLQRWATKNL